MRHNSGSCFAMSTLMKRICLVIADATRARIYTFEQLEEPDGPHDELREVADLVDPARRKRPSELFSDSAGGNHVGRRGYAFDDHRQGHLDRLDASFAREIVAEAVRITHAEGYRELVVVASSTMLGQMRESLESLRRTLTVTECERDLTRHATAALRDRLAALELLPPRPHIVVSNR